MLQVVENEREEEDEIINEIEEEMRKIHLMVEKLYDSMSTAKPHDPFDNFLIANHCYSLALFQRELKDIEKSIQSDNSVKMLENSLEEEINYLRNDVEKITRKMVEYNMIFDRIDQNVADINEIMEKHEKEFTSTNSLSDITRHLKMRFKKEKADLKGIISGLFPTNLDVQDLIAKIIEHNLSEGFDKYLQLEESDNIIEQIEALKRTKLFEVNPHDFLQIRLADLT